MFALTDTSGTFVEYYEYDVFGEPTIWDANAQEIVESSIVGNPFMFTGRRFDDETGLYYYRARYYDYYIGRFLQVDPIGNEIVNNISNIPSLLFHYKHSQHCTYGRFLRLPWVFFRNHLRLLSNRITRKVGVAEEPILLQIIPDLFRHLQALYITVYSTPSGHQPLGMVKDATLHQQIKEVRTFEAVLNKFFMFCKLAQSIISKLAALMAIGGEA